MEVFASSTTTKMESPASFTFEVPNGYWTLHIDVREHATTSAHIILSYIIVVAVIISFLVFLVLRKAQLLQMSTKEIFQINEALKAEIAQRKQYEAKLMEMNAELTNRVNAEVNAKIEKEQLLIQQSKMAAMGEMIGVIAHQWRQPLNAISLLISDVMDAYKYNELNGEYLK